MPQRQTSNTGPEPVEFGRFERPSDGAQVTATTVDEANRYRFDGWQEIAPADPDNDWAAKAEAERQQAEADAAKAASDGDQPPTE